MTINKENLFFSDKFKTKYGKFYSSTLIVYYLIILFNREKDISHSDILSCTEIELSRKWAQC